MKLASGLIRSYVNTIFSATDLFSIVCRFVKKNSKISLPNHVYCYGKWLIHIGTVFKETIFDLVDCVETHAYLYLLFHDSSFWMELSYTFSNLCFSQSLLTIKCLIRMIHCWNTHYPHQKCLRSQQEKKITYV